jgi:hypothetical protein
MKYAYEDLGDQQFEKLVVFLCQRILGMGVQGFAQGVDGGRDAKFVGTAQLHPSTTAPWKGTTIIQAKHTNGYNKNFSEPDFYSKKTDKTILGNELPRVKKMHGLKQLDHYMLFSNRRLAANAESEIVAYISKPSGVPPASIYLCGVEQLEIWLTNFPEVPTLANLDLVDSPLIVNSDDLSEVVQAFARHKDAVKAVLEDPPTPRISYETKNSLNNMTKEYAFALRRRYLKETPQIRAFVAAPENSELLQLYLSVVDEFQLKIIANRRDYQTFDDMMEYLVDLLFSRDPVLRQHKRLTRAVLFYMYWNCDIGDAGDVATN